MSGLTRVLAAIAVVAIAEAGAGASLRADPFYQGSGKCADCHRAETHVGCPLPANNNPQITERAPREC
jgi:hypothetical protein